MLNFTQPQRLFTKANGFCKNHIGASVSRPLATIVLSIVATGLAVEAPICDV
jgi:hypothetical protein